MRFPNPACGLTLLGVTAFAAPNPKQQILFLDVKPYERYLVERCDKGNDCTSGTDGKFTGGDSDCAHFVAHAIYAGGVTIKGTAMSCNKGLVVRALELRQWFDDAIEKYANVEKLSGWQSSQALDIGFIESFYVRRWDIGFDAVHALVLAAASAEKTGTFYAHTNDRCGKEEISYGKTIGGVTIDRPVVFYRISSSPLNGGKWSSGGTPSTSRFVLEFKNRDVTLLERGIESAQGKTQTRTLRLEDAGPGEYVIRRPNDDSALQLLSVTSAALRQQIVSRNPEPSTLSIRLKGNGTIAVTWRGLAFTKKSDGSLNQITQPSAAQHPAEFVFSRSN